MVFVDLVKELDCTKKVIWWVLRRKDIMLGKVFTVTEIFKQLKEFKVKVGIHQGSVISPFLFLVVVNEIKKDKKRRLCETTSVC